MRTLIQDLRYGLRILGRNPGFTAVAVITLALGIGVNTAMFSVVYGVLLRPLPYPHPERIVELARTYLGQFDMANFNARAIEFWENHRAPFEHLAASTGVGFNLSGAGEPERLRALRVSLEYFEVYGVSPALGRSFTAEEEQAGGPNVTVLSHGLWERHFGGSGDVLGRTILLDGTPFTIIGVMPAGFESLPAVDLWTTIGQVNSTIGSGWNYDAIGRLKPGISRAKASSYLAALTEPFFKQFIPRLSPKFKKTVSFGAYPYQYVISSDLRTPLFVLFGAIGLVLIIACANVANLMLGHAAARSREMAVRAALGASRARLFRQLLVESVLLAALGGALGLVVAYWGLAFLMALAPPKLIHAQQVSINGWTLVFTALAALLTGIGFGAAPAFRAAETDVSAPLKANAEQASAGHVRRRASGAMVIAEIALSLVLLVGSGLLIETFANLLRTNPGFDLGHVLSLQVWTTGSKYQSTPALSNLYDSIVRRIEQIPSVRGAALVAAGLPLERGGNVGVRIEGQAKELLSDYREITPGYFRTMKIPLLRGRVFTDADSTGANRVVIVNAAFVRHYFPQGNPIGEHVINLDANRLPMEIVGVVGDVRSSLNEPAPPTIFVPMAQVSYATDKLFQGWFPTCIVVRTAGNPLALSRPIESAVRDVAPDVPIGQSRSMEEVLSISVAFQRFLATLMTVFAALALALAAVGLYGVISYAVSQRTHEIGIRMALGAERRDVLVMILGNGFVLALIGCGIGVAGALALTRFLAGILFGVKPSDPVTLLAVSLLLIGVALLASYIPARRASKVDPMVALRYE